VQDVNGRLPSPNACPTHTLDGAVTREERPGSNWSSERSNGKGGARRTRW
jgi:hypothetical protein